MVINDKYGKKAVAFLDILGFKGMIEKLSIAEIATKYETMIDQITRLGNTYSGKRFIFSDSIILIANDDSDNSFVDLVVYTWRILQFSLAAKMPIRGAISYGDIYVNESLNVFLGKGLTDSYLLEGKQQWIGVILDRVVEERYKNIFSNSLIVNELLPIHDVPFKDGSINTYRVVNWRLNLVVKKGTRSLFVNKDDNKDVQKKIDNTLKFAKKIVDSKRIYLSGNDVPTQLRTFWIGDTQPPFSQGDDL